MIRDDPNDPKGLVFEAYRIEGITAPECRSIFLDWALSIGTDDPRAAIKDLLARFGVDAPDHPMSVTLTAALADAGPARRKGGRAARMAAGRAG